MSAGVHEIQKNPTFTGCKARELTAGGADDTWGRGDVLRAGIHVAEEALERAGSKSNCAGRLVRISKSNGMPEVSGRLGEVSRPQGGVA